jgi:hypothetical protein
MSELDVQVWPPNGSELVGTCYCGMCSSLASKENRCIWFPAMGLVLCRKCLAELLNRLVTEGQVG